MIKKSFIQSAGDGDEWEMIVDYREIRKEGVIIEEVLNYLSLEKPA